MAERIAKQKPVKNASVVKRKIIYILIILYKNTMDTTRNGDEELNPAGDGVECFGIMRFLIDHDGMEEAVHRMCWKGESIIFAGFREFEGNVERAVILVEF